MSTFRMFSGVRPVTRDSAIRDALAGFQLGAMNIPQALGYTKIAGMPVIPGLYTLLFPLVAFAAFGSSRFLVVAADSATAAILAGEDGGSRGIGSHHQKAGGAECRERNQREQQRVEAGDDRHTRDLGVAERLRDIHRAELESCQGIADRAVASYGPHAAEHSEGGHRSIRQSARQAGTRNVVVWSSGRRSTPAQETQL